MKTVDITFKNRPNDDGTLTTLTVKGCLVAQRGSPAASRPEIIIHLPKTFTDTVRGAWVEWDGGRYHVTGLTVRGVEKDVPTAWNRYVIAERIY